MFENLKKDIINSALAGICIAIGGAVLLSCQEAVAFKYVGALLFSVALLCICLEGYSLYTGKICYFLDNKSKKNILRLLSCLFFNILSCSVCASVFKTNKSLVFKALTMCENKLLKSPFQIFFDAFFCGILIYLAVNIYKTNKSIIGIMFCIPTFILCGFEHCVADAFYFALANTITFGKEISTSLDIDKMIFFMAVAIAGNSFGGLFLPFLKKLRVSKKNL